MTKEELNAKVEEIEGRAEQFAQTTLVNGPSAQLLEDMAALVGLIGEARSIALSEAVDVCNAAREEGDTDARGIRDRISGL